MTGFEKIAFIGNYLPRRCGIATFTHDLHHAVSAARPDLGTSIVAMTDPDRTYAYPPSVHLQIREERVGDYVRAAEFLNATRVDVVNLQHEYGIFGGEAGGDIVRLLSRLDMPIVTTLHTGTHQADVRTAPRDTANHSCFRKSRRHVGEGAQGSAVCAPRGSRQD